MFCQDLLVLIRFFTIINMLYSYTLACHSKDQTSFTDRRRSYIDFGVSEGRPTGVSLATLEADRLILKDFTQTLNDHKIPDYEEIIRKIIEKMIEEQHNQGYSRYYLRKLNSFGI